jgi:hypothetical protein
LALPVEKPKHNCLVDLALPSGDGGNVLALNFGSNAAATCPDVPS